MPVTYSRLSFYALGAIGGIYAVFIGLLTVPWLQRHALYANRFHTAWWHDVNKPESFGFASGQVTPFNITTPDGETLYAWHILPVDEYGANAKAILAEKEAGNVSFEDSIAYKLLQKNDSRLAIFYHGNAGHVAQGHRPSAMSNLLTIPNTHVLTIDYRGFGLSTAHTSPTEAGLITDAVAAATWALTTMWSSDRVVLVGHSLGSAVAAAVTLHFALLGKPGGPPLEDTPFHGPIAFAGVVLAASFADVPSLLRTYAIGGVVPILSPLTPFPALQGVLGRAVVDTWDTAGRLRTMGQRGDAMSLFVVHAVDDWEVGWRNSDAVFAAAVEGMSSSAEAGALMMSTPVEERGGEAPGVLFRRSGGINKREIGQGDGFLFAEQCVLRSGGHNAIVAYAEVAMMVRRAFEGVEREVFED